MASEFLSVGASSAGSEEEVCASLLGKSSSQPTGERPLGRWQPSEYGRSEAKVPVTPVAKHVKSRVATPKRVTVGAPPDAVVVVPLEPLPNTRIIELKITMVPHAAAPSVAHWRSFEASIARVANRGSMAPTVRVDHDLRGATIQIDGWNAATAIRMVRLHATNSPSPQLWQSRDYDVSVIHTGELISP